MISLPSSASKTVTVLKSLILTLTNVKIAPQENITIPSGINVSLAQLQIVEYVRRILVLQMKYALNAKTDILFSRTQLETMFVKKIVLRILTIMLLRRHALSAHLDSTLINTLRNAHSAQTIVQHVSLKMEQFSVILANPVLLYKEVLKDADYLALRLNLSITLL